MCAGARCPAAAGLPLPVVSLPALRMGHRVSARREGSPAVPSSSLSSAATPVRSCPLLPSPPPLPSLPLAASFPSLPTLFPPCVWLHQRGGSGCPFMVGPAVRRQDNQPERPRRLHPELQVALQLHSLWWIPTCSCKLTRVRAARAAE